MRQSVYTRPFNEKDPEEKKLFAEWLFAMREKNRFDPAIFEKGQVTILTCFDEGGILGFVPVALAYVLESLAFRPGISPATEARCLEAVQHHLVHCAIEKNMPYAFFVTFDEEVQEFAQRRYGWKKTEVPMLTFDFNKLEPKYGRT